MKPRIIVAQVLTGTSSGYNYSERNNIFIKASDIIIRFTDDVTLNPSSQHHSIDYRVRTLQVGNELAKLQLIANSEEFLEMRRGFRIPHFFIFLSSIDDLLKSEIKLLANGKLQVPHLLHNRSAYESLEEVTPDKCSVWIVGNKNFTDSEIKIAKEYAEENHLNYIGECNLSDNRDIEKTMESLASNILYPKEKRLVDQAYTSGAAAGVLNDKVPLEVGLHVGSFLSRKDGAALARTSKSGAITAKDREAIQLDSKLPELIKDTLSTIKETINKYYKQKLPRQKNTLFSMAGPRHKKNVEALQLEIKNISDSKSLSLIEKQDKLIEALRHFVNEKNPKGGEHFRSAIMQMWQDLKESQDRLHIKRDELKTKSKL